MRIIKKEKDSKLYDSEIKKYVNLDVLLSYIESKVKFKIINESNKDITKEVLFAVAFYKNHLLNYSKEDLVAFLEKGLTN